jgi:oxaloacetate decarboxylase alpha subunit
MQLVYERLIEHGISRFVVLDPMHDMDAVLASARTIKRAGGRETIAALTYTISALHDDAFYAGSRPGWRRRTTWIASTSRIPRDC